VLPENKAYDRIEGASSDCFLSLTHTCAHGKVDRMPDRQHESDWRRGGLSDGRHMRCAFRGSASFA
jgi:hypothetical protein